MSYSGKTFSIPCNRGGLTANPNIDLIAPEMMVLARNINIFENGRGRRGGTKKVNSSAGYGSTQLTGIHDFTLTGGAQFVVATTTDGQIWKNSTTSLKTGLTAAKFSSFEVVNDKIYICNGADIPQIWDGSAGSTSNMAAVPTDWTGSNYPVQIIKHGSGNSIRGWAYIGNTIYFTPDTAGGDFDFAQGTINTLFIETGDGAGITGGYVFGDRIFFTSNSKTYRIDDTDINVSNWGYKEIQGTGGAAHWRLIIPTDNDVLAMMEDGNIYSVVAVQEYGDYKLASITRKSWIDKWIRENTNLARINQFHGVYDKELRLVKIFVVRSGQTQVDTCLVYAIDRGPEEGWVIHDNLSNNSGYDASVATVVRRSPAEDHSFYVYTGDYSGFVWELEEVAKNDDGLAYYSGFKTARLPFDNPRATKKYKRGWMVTEEKGNYNLYINIWVDGVAQTQQSVDLSGAGALWGTMVWGSFTWAGDVMIDQPFDIGAVGKRIQIEVFNSSADEDFFVSQILFDHRVLSARPS